MENCIFCKIASKQIPAEIVHEDENFLAFLDINPKGSHHTLLIPKAHYHWFYELPDELYDEMFRKVKTLVPILKEKAGADYVKLGIVGTDVPHVHVHLIPRKLSEKDNVI
ncbi:MAG: HIT family protein [Patescibacteria group bacterium]